MFNKGIGGVGKQVVSEMAQAGKQVVQDIASIPGEMMQDLAGGSSSEQGMESVSTGGGANDGGQTGNAIPGVNTQAMVQQQKQAHVQDRLAQIRKRIAEMQGEEEVILEEEKQRKKEEEEMEDIEREQESQEKLVQQQQRARGMNSAQAYMHDSQGAGEGMGRKRKG